MRLAISVGRQQAGNRKPSLSRITSYVRRRIEQ
jgi:hypothetical protein